MSSVLRHAVVFALGLAATVAHAQLSIEITGGSGNNRIPVSIADFGGDLASAKAVTSVVRNDLEHCGMFKMVDPGPTPMTENDPVNFGNWRNKGADAVAGGSLASGGGHYEARFRLYDITKQASLGGAAFVTSPATLRAAGHRIADYIYEKLLGIPGYFSTRISYVVKQRGRYELMIADSDGQNAQPALVSKEPIISPAWSPDGSKLAYVSFESKKPVIYVHTLATGRRAVVANFKGSNSAPAWSPDGRRLAIVLSKDGGSQMFTINADGSGVQRLTYSSGIDTEPRYSADGQYIYFTSDRGGSPQIYRMPTMGGSAERVTYDGAYNVSPRPSPDGKNLVYISRNSGRFQVAIMDIASHQTQILTDSSKDESPSFAPNGQMILYATVSGGRQVLSAVSPDGRIKQRLTVLSGDVREPAWGPSVK